MKKNRNIQTEGLAEYGLHWLPFFLSKNRSYTGDTRIVHVNLVRESRRSLLAFARWTGRRKHNLITINLSDNRWLWAIKRVYTKMCASYHLPFGSHHSFYYGKPQPFFWSIKLCH